MEVSSRRVLLRHLEPARPLRRCVHVNVALTQCSLLLRHLFETFKEKIYTRDFLIGLAGCPEAKKRPEYLPDHPIVLPEAVS
uniref:Uncharacterized protein n=1 Tax=Xiphophorus couchianus TaxID=32473 RepID=A0A3B5MSG9_9TELE